MASQLVGSAALPTNTRFHAFLWNGSIPFWDLGDLGDIYQRNASSQLESLYTYEPCRKMNQFLIIKTS